VFINTGDINIGNNINIGNRTDISNRIANTSNLDSSRLQNRNVYTRPETRQRNAESAAVRQQHQQARPAANRANDLYTDRSGNVARINGDAWETRKDGSWETQRDLASSREARPNLDQNRPSVNYSDLNRSHLARQHGTNRERQMTRSMPARGGSRRR
jgi:hypothetical protein